MTEDEEDERDDDEFVQHGPRSSHPTLMPASKAVPEPDLTGPRTDHVGEKSRWRTI